MNGGIVYLGFTFRSESKGLLCLGEGPCYKNMKFLLFMPSLITDILYVKQNGRLLRSLKSHTAAVLCLNWAEDNNLINVCLSFLIFLCAFHLPFWAWWINGLLEISIICENYDWDFSETFGSIPTQLLLFSTSVEYMFWTNKFWVNSIKFEIVVNPWLFFKFFNFFFLNLCW